ATSVGLKEQEAINFLEKKIKNDPEFSYDETTAISSLQSVLQEDFKANEIEFEGEGWQFEGEGKCVKIPQNLKELPIGLLEGKPRINRGDIRNGGGRAKDKAIRKAIHADLISMAGDWDLCTDKIRYYHDAGSMIPYHKNLTARGYRALIFRRPDRFSDGLLMNY
ncbi:serine carboxypeptidase 1, partial [Tanacetum coccineum]